MTDMIDPEFREQIGDDEKGEWLIAIIGGAFVMFCVLAVLATIGAHTVWGWFR